MKKIVWQKSMELYSFSALSLQLLQNSIICERYPLPDTGIDIILNITRDKFIDN